MTENDVAGADDQGSIGNAGAAEPDSLTVEIEPRLVDVINVSAAMNRSTLAVIGLGGYFATAAVMSIYFGLPLFAPALAGLLAAALLSGYYSAPWIWFSTNRSRRIDLSAESMTFNSEGVQYRSPTSESHRAWSFYRRARDLGTALVLDGRGGGGTIVLKSALSPEEVAHLHRIIERQGLFHASVGFTVLLRLSALLTGAAAALIQFNVSTF